MSVSSDVAPKEGNDRRVGAPVKALLSSPALT